MDVGRTLTEADTWDKASHSCSRPATVSTPGNGAAPDNTHTQTWKKRRKKKWQSRAWDHKNVLKNFEFELCCATYKRCQVQLVQICEACAPLQIWCLIGCPPATWRQHITHTVYTTVHTGRQVSFNNLWNLHFSATRLQRMFGNWMPDSEKTSESLSVWGDETKRKCLASLWSLTPAKSGTE